MQFAADENDPVLSFIIDTEFPLPNRLHRDRFQLADAKPQTAKSLKNQRKLPLPHVLCSPHQAVIFLFIKLPLFLAEHLPLNLDRLYTKIRPVHKAEKAVESRQHRIDAPDMINGEEIMFKLNNLFFRNRFPACIRCAVPIRLTTLLPTDKCFKHPDIMQIFVYRRLSPLFFYQIFLIPLQRFFIQKPAALICHKRPLPSTYAANQWPSLSRTFYHPDIYFIIIKTERQIIYGSRTIDTNLTNKIDVY